MCGIVAAVGEFDYRFRDVFKQMQVVCSLRGNDSTGIAGVNIRMNTVEILKVVGSPYDLFEHKKYDEVASSIKNNVLIGHGRSATQGVVTKANAHPFNQGTITGVHNGTLTNWRSLPGDEVYGTDSETLYSNIAEYGVEEIIPQVQGAYALVWYDEADKTFNILRNNERTLYYCFSDNLNKMFVASEVGMLQWILGRNGVKLWKDEEGFSFFPVPEDNWLVYSVPKTANEKIQLMSQKVVKGNVKKQSGPFGYRSPWEGWRHNDDLDDKEPLRLPPATTSTPAGSGNTNSSTNNVTLLDSKRQVLSPPATTPSSTPDNKRNNLDESTNISERKGFANELLSEKEYLSRTDGVCTFCGEEIEFKDIENVKWTSRDTVLCRICVPDGEDTSKVFAGHTAHCLV